MTRSSNVLGAALVAGLSLLGAQPTQAAPDNLFENFGPVVRWVHLYSADDGISYVEEMPVPESDGQWGNKVLFDTKAERAVIGYWPDGFQSPWHSAGHVNVLIYLQGEQVIETGDGKEHRLKPGMAVLAEDWAGRGHRYRCEAKDKKRGCLVLQITVGDLDKSLPMRRPPGQ